MTSGRTGGKGFIVAGTDTGVGKTVLSAALVRAVDGAYWKPVQAGTDNETDIDVVRQLSGLSAERMLKEVYRLRQPQSPHIAAVHDGVTISKADLALPASDRTLVIELAGGLLVPLSDQLMQIDMAAEWGYPVVLCARTRLGTINHTLLSVEALRSRRIAIHGIAFIGYSVPEVENSIAELSGVRRLGRLPMIEPLNEESLADAFDVGFDVGDFKDGDGTA